MATGIFTLRNQLQSLIQKAWTGTQKTNFVEYLVVAGGGSGGGRGSGGGGAGGLLQGLSNVTIGSSITVTVGAGGAKPALSSDVVGNSGANSVFGAITATGGGGGGGLTPNPTSGGSGGGVGKDQNKNGAQGVFGQGNTGGNVVGSSDTGTGGGGGAGTVGLTGRATEIGGNGGAGIASAISGTLTTYAGGGGGSSYTSGVGGAGGIGGGGAGGTGGPSASSANAGTDGTTNTGGGGGGLGYAGYGTYQAGAGGSGICIISYPDTYNAPTTLTGTYTASTSGSGSIYLNGSSYLVGPTTSALNFGTGNYTIEFWIYPTVTPATLDIFLSASAGSNNAQIGFSPSQYLYSNFPSIRTGTSASIKLNQWNHVALVRSGTNVALFSNGTRVGTATDSTSTSYTNYYIGTYNAGPGSYNAENAYMSNIRMSNVAVYDPTQTTYTVPTAPFVAVSSTVLLMSSVSGAYLADSSASSLTLSSVTGSPAWNQSSPFATGLGYKNRVYTWTGSGTVTF